MWYTPPEIVQYMVTRVDTVLREELGIADGLADPRVCVLDPCCGAGAYPVAVLQRIATTLREQGDDALLGDDLKWTAVERLFGFELLPVPFVVAACNWRCCKPWRRHYSAVETKASDCSVFLSKSLQWSHVLLDVETTHGERPIITAVGRLSASSSCHKKYKLACRS